MHRKAKANVNPVRQRTQFTCMSTSMMMCLNALGIKCDEEEVNKVMGARPMKGAAWEDALACAQHYGVRGTLVVPSTVRQMKKWTDQGFPVMIAWNPEGRPWSHASIVFDVKEGDDGKLMVYVADPNMPNPEKTVRVLSDDEFYGKWYEKWPDYLVRRPALCLSPEITSDGCQVMASSKNTSRDSSEHAEKAFDLKGVVKTVLTYMSDTIPGWAPTVMERSRKGVSEISFSYEDPDTPILWGGEERKAHQKFKAMRKKLKRFGLEASNLDEARYTDREGNRVQLSIGGYGSAVGTPLRFANTLENNGAQVMGSQKKVLKDYENRRKNFVPTFEYSDAVQVREGILGALENIFKASKQKIAAVTYKELSKVEKTMGAPIENKLGVAKAITNYVVEGFEKSTRVPAVTIRTTVSASSIDNIVRSMVKWEKVPLRAVVASARIVGARYLGSKQHKSS